MGALLQNNGTVTQLVRNTRQFNQITDRAIFQISVFQPFYTALSSMTPNQKQMFIDMQAQIQLNLGTNLITYPYMDYGLNDYIAFIDRYYPNQQNISAIFTLDMATPIKNFEAILKHISEKSGPKIIALIYREWEKTVLQHLAVNKYFDEENVAFVACQVERENFQANASNLHGIQFAGFDLMALKQNVGFPEPVIDLNKIKFIDVKRLGFNSVHESFKNQNGQTIQDFDLAPDNSKDLITLQKMERGYMGARIHGKKFNLLTYLAKMHEALKSPPEFSVSQKFIGSRESLAYINQKNNLQKMPILQQRS